MNAANYEVDGKKRGLEEIKRMHERKSRNYCHKIKSSYITVKARLDGVPVKIFFIHYEKQPRWTLMIPTDTELSFSRAFQTYSIRWNIEILWKECKKYLDLGTYQERNLNGQIADCTLVFITHTMLTLEKIFSEYETMGNSFGKWKNKSER